jgi:RsiW-degrading membrane proteinase PrsW (M82 family)
VSRPDPFARISISSGPRIPRPSHARHPKARLRAVLAIPAVWMLLIVVTVGAWRIADLMNRAFLAYPVAATTAVVLFVLYAVPFILLLRAIDYLEREPFVLQASAVAWGGLVATATAISASTALQDVLAKGISPQYATDWGPAVVGAGVEEVLKVLGVVTIALIARGQINSVVDGFVYGALVGLGFQVVEDIVFAINAVVVSSGDDQVGPVIVTFFLRGFLGGLWSHTLFTGMAGAGVAYALVQRNRSRLVRGLVFAGLLGAAWFFHFLWNTPLLADGFGYGVAGVIAAMLIKGLPALAVGVTLVLAAERREADYYAAMLAKLGDHKMATPEEIEALVWPRRRVAERRRARERLGWPGARAVRRLQRAQAHLAVAVSRDPDAEVLRRRLDVLARRHELTALSLAGQVQQRRPTRLSTPVVFGLQLLLVCLLLLGLGIMIRALGGT